MIPSQFYIDEKLKQKLFLHRFTRKLISESEKALNSPEWTFDGSPFRNPDRLSFLYGLFAFDYLLGLIAFLVPFAIIVAYLVFMDVLMYHAFFDLLLHFLIVASLIASIILIPKKFDKRRLGQFELRDDAIEMKEKIEASLESDTMLSEDRRAFLESAAEFLGIAIKELSRVDTGRRL